MSYSEPSGKRPRLPPHGDRSWYEVLDLGRDASQSQIEEAYDRAIALIEGKAIGGYMVLDPEATASAKSDVETAFLVLSDPALRAAFDAAIVGDAEPPRVSELIDEEFRQENEEWVVSGPPALASEDSDAAQTSLPAQAASEPQPDTDSKPEATSGETRLDDAAKLSKGAITRSDSVAGDSVTDDSESLGENAKQERQAAGSKRKPVTQKAGTTKKGEAALLFLKPVYDDTSGPVQAARGEFEGKRSPVGARPRLLKSPAFKEPSAGVRSTKRAPTSDSRPSSRPRLAASGDPARRPEIAGPSSSEQVTAPPTSAVVVSQIKTLPPDLEDALQEGAEVNGQVIKRLRESRGLSLDDVASATHIRKSYLCAIEEMDFTELPAPVYLRGFLTQIARVLKVDKKKLSQGYLSFSERFRD